MTEGVPAILRGRTTHSGTDFGVFRDRLARQIEARPEIVRRLFTADGANPTLATVLKLAEALGFHLELVPNRPAA